MKSREETTLETYWTLPAAEVARRLETSEDGLSYSRARFALKRFGENRIFHSAADVSELRLFLKQFKDPLVLILLVAAAISLIVHELTDALIISLIIVASAILTFIQERRASRAMEVLLARLSLMSRVIREGHAISISAGSVVPGDLVLLSAGSLIPADGVLWEAKDLHVNQGALTGESFPAEKEPGVSAPDAPLGLQRNCVFTGTSVRSGTAKMIAVNTGGRTHFGKVAERLRGRAPETDFERGMRQFGYLLTRAMVGFVLIILAANIYLGKPPIDSLLFSLAIAVGISPELLPAILGMTLARGAQRMAKAGVIVRKLSSIESLGSMDVLCSDKTGTLTTGKTRLDRVLDREGRPSGDLELLVHLNAALQSGIVNPLDEAIRARFVAEKDRVNDFEKVDEIPYDFQRRRLTIVVRSRGTGSDRHLLIMKGALSQVIQACEPAQTDDTRVESQSAAWSREGLRVLGIATKEVTPKTAYTRSDETGFTFRGFLLFDDPLHPDAAAAVRELSGLGVSLKIISGDNRHVGAHVASIVGLDPARLLAGSELQGLDDETLGKRAETVAIFSEVDPQQKERIILALKKRGHVVGYLGDGINDAPALQAADVGISVESAVDVAREAADLVMVQAHLKVLAEGIRNGRVTFANTLKYIFTTTSANFGNMITMSLASLYLPFLPLLASQVLLNNFLSSIPAFTLQSDTVDGRVFVSPLRWNIARVRGFMVRFGVISSVFDVLTFAFLLFPFHASREVFRTAWFVESLLTQIAIIFAVRTSVRFYRSRPSRALLLSSLATAAVSVAIPFSPAARWFSFVPISAGLLAILLVITALYFAVSEAAKSRFIHW